MRFLFLSALAGAAVLSAAPAAWTSQTDDVGPARRAYRAECTKFEPADYCECITAGFAQSLSVEELTLARLRLPMLHAAAGATPRRALVRAAPGLGFADESSRIAAFGKIDALERELQNTCGAPA